MKNENVSSIVVKVVACIVCLVVIGIVVDGFQQKSYADSGIALLADRILSIVEGLCVGSGVVVIIVGALKAWEELSIGRLSWAIDWAVAIWALPILLKLLLLTLFF